MYNTIRKKRCVRRNGLSEQNPTWEALDGGMARVTVPWPRGSIEVERVGKRII